MKPLHGFVLLSIPPNEEEVTEGGIVIPGGVVRSSLKTGVVLDVGPGVSPQDSKIDSGLKCGEKVLFDPRGENTIGLDEGKALVPFEAIFAVLENEDHGQDKIDTLFFDLSTWSDFKGAHYSDWEQYLNLKLFSIRVSFLEPFGSLDNLAKKTHESCVGAMRGVENFNLSNIQFGKKENKIFTIVNDDVWDGGFTIDSEHSYIEFQKIATDIPTIHKTCPRLLSAFHSVLKSQEFSRVAERDFSRLTSVVFRFQQRLSIKGRGAKGTPAKNSELMQQFLLFGEHEGKNPTLNSLGILPVDIERIDMDFGFKKVIDNHT